jgi:hypothetical protein
MHTAAPPRRADELGALAATAEQEGLAAGLRRVLAAGLPVPCSASGLTLLPAGSAGGVPAWQLPSGLLGAGQICLHRLRHPLAEAEGLQLVQVLPGTGARPRPGAGTVQAALLVAAVRTGLCAAVLRRAARYAEEREVAGGPMAGKQLVQGELADAATGVELVRLGLRTAAGAAAVEDLHDRLDAVGWGLVTLFGGSGFLVDGPARSLYVAELLRDAWRAADTSAGEG